METLICEEEVQVLLEPIEKYDKVLGTKSSEPTIVTIESYKDIIHYYNQLHLSCIEEKNKTVKFRLNQEIDSISALIKFLKITYGKI